MYYTSLFFIFFLSILSNYASAETQLDIDDLEKYVDIKKWPIMDARELSVRSQSPIPGALEFSSEFSVEGPILIISSDNDSATKMAKKIEKVRPEAKTFILNGGYKTLRLIHPELMPEKILFSLPGTFNIPRNTCKQGNPVQVYSDKKDK